MNHNLLINGVVRGLRPAWNRVCDRSLLEEDGLHVDIVYIVYKKDKE